MQLRPTVIVLAVVALATLSVQAHPTPEGTVNVEKENARSTTGDVAGEIASHTSEAVASGGGAAYLLYSSLKNALQAGGNLIKLPFVGVRDVATKTADVVTEQGKKAVAAVSEKTEQAKEDISMAAKGVTNKVGSGMVDLGGKIKTEE
ncbi:hypothetical protein IWQ60_010627 [Tieghemiomyces parasiticus]|uniref:Uncharacterized protein n=1 Tax=Tieghemiomyces parasiticus TaxID=78921 RepID=A0A9W7ZSI3_9FUNG|nr:hypothetical protein IWQ60_010627 [Tieghemiomyces parasiticus]